MQSSARGGTIVFPLVLLVLCLSIVTLDGCKKGSPITTGPPITLAPFGVFAESHDGGFNWVVSDSLYFAKKLYAASWTSNNIIFVIAGQDTNNRATIWRSTDSGFHWTGVITLSDGTIAFNHITQTPGYANLVAVSSAGHVFRSSNIGATWLAEVSGGSALNAVHFFLQGGIGVAVGYSGRIIRSTDDGSTWASVSSGTTQDLFGVHCIGAGSVALDDTIIAVGNAGTVVRSTDAGSTWIVSTLPTPEILKAVCFSGDPFGNGMGRYGLAVGNGGAAFKTTDGGISWQQKSIAGGGNYEDVIINNDGSKCLIMGAAVARTKFYTSADRGQTWSNQPDIPGYFYKFAYKTFESTDYGFAVGVPY